jgi:anthranilate phosphoribosyltransferase
VRTIFNFLGPLTNPAGATRQLIGVSDPAYLQTLAGALRRLGTEHALLVCSEDGLDELSISAPTHVVEVVGERIETYTVRPVEVGLEPAPPEAVPGGDPEHNAQVTRQIFAGQRGPGRAESGRSSGGCGPPSERSTRARRRRCSSDSSS